MRGGRQVAPAEPVGALRERCLTGLARLPQRCRQINRAAAYPVRYSKQLEELLEKVRRRVRGFAVK
jgi:nicotinate phosphoribosyltransferase